MQVYIYICINGRWNINSYKRHIIPSYLLISLPQMKESMFIRLLPTMGESFDELIPCWFKTNDGIMVTSYRDIF